MWQPRYKRTITQILLTTIKLKFLASYFSISPFRGKSRRTNRGRTWLKLFTVALTTSWPDVFRLIQRSEPHANSVLPRLRFFIFCRKFAPPNTEMQIMRPVLIMCQSGDSSTRRRVWISPERGRAAAALGRFKRDATISWDARLIWVTLVKCCPRTTTMFFHPPADRHFYFTSAKSSSFREGQKPRLASWNINESLAAVIEAWRPAALIHLVR